MGIQCGTTADFCTNTGTGAPGTAAPGTNGCISNCGTNIVRSGPPAQYRSVAFYEGFNLDRSCLYQTARQVDASAYTHLFFAFGTLDTGYNVQTGDELSTFAFQEFLQVTGPAKVLSIGGWAFSTDPSTYTIFRDGVTAANRYTMASNIASFVSSHNLDGVNIDWEYPGVSDMQNDSLQRRVLSSYNDTDLSFFGFRRHKISLAFRQPALMMAPTTWIS